MSLLSTIIASKAAGLFFLIKWLGDHGHRDIAQLIIYGALWGAICAVPTLILASVKKQAIGPYFWGHIDPGFLRQNPR